jgi:hypothetical protein
MKHLNEIARIVTKKKVRKIEIFDDASLKHKNSKFNEFYEALLAQKFKNDRDASAFLYDCSPTDDKYRQLKSRFRKRLLNTLFFLDVNTPSTSGYDRAYYTCNKDWTLVKILLSNGALSTAADLAEGILAIALKYKFADIIVNCSRILREDAARERNTETYELYDQHSKQYADVLSAEIRSEELYQRVIMNYDTPESQEQLKDKIDTYCEALVGLSEMYDSPVIIYNMYLVWIFRYEMLRDFESIVEVCQRAETYVEDNPVFYQDEKIATIYTKKIAAYLHLKDFRNGKLAAEKAIQGFGAGSNEWFTFMEYYFLLAMHTENYINALAIHSEVSNHSKFKKLTATEREKWNVFEVYINYIIEKHGASNPVLQAQKRRNFKVARFVADPVLYPRDQRSFTALMVIGQFLFLLDKNNPVPANERVERLKTYALRQLKKEEDFRAIQFIKLLQQLFKAEYNAADLSNTEKYLDRLHDQPFYYAGAIQDVEPIKYEVLWDLVLKQVK